MHEERHVRPGRAGGWNVTKTGARGPSSRHATQREAVRRARVMLLEDGGELFIHDGDGDVRATVRYPPRTNRRVHPASYR